MKRAPVRYRDGRPVFLTCLDCRICAICHYVAVYTRWNPHFFGLIALLPLHYNLPPVTNSPYHLYNNLVSRNLCVEAETQRKTKEFGRYVTDGTLRND